MQDKAKERGTGEEEKRKCNSRKSQEKGKIRENFLPERVKKGEQERRKSNERKSQEKGRRGGNLMQEKVKKRGEEEKRRSGRASCRERV